MGYQDEWLLFEAEDDVDEIEHRQPTEEFLFYQAVSNGNVAAVRKNCEQERFLDSEGVGILSRNQVTNLKYHFVITTAMITRLCRQKGMELEQAFRMSDFYIQKLDDIHTVQECIICMMKWYWIMRKRCSYSAGVIPTPDISAPARNTFIPISKNVLPLKTWQMNLECRPATFQGCLKRKPGILSAPISGNRKLKRPEICSATVITLLLRLPTVSPFLPRAILYSSFGKLWV